MRVLADEAFRVAEWHDFFITVGGAAAALAGLVFVALSINLEALATDPFHRHRSVGTLTNFAGVFVICTLALMGGQGRVAVGAEWLIVSAAAGAIYVYGFVRARTSGATATTLSVLRTASGTAMYAAEIVGACALLGGATWGVYVAATAMVALSAYSVTGAWLLLIGAPKDVAHTAHRESTQR